MRRHKGERECHCQIINKQHFSKKNHGKESLKKKTNIYRNNESK